ncbi:MAG: discoidin domain-containing protein [Fibrobacterales bacterium]
MKYSYILVLLLMLLSNTLFAGPVSDHGDLQVLNKGGEYGYTICDIHGNPYQLKGFSALDLKNWDTEWVVGHTIPNIVSLTGSNAVRVAMYTYEAAHGYMNQDAAGKALYRQKMKDLIQDAILSDIYILVDWHILNDPNPWSTEYYNEAYSFFTEIAQEYGAFDNLLFELGNEPLAVSFPNTIKPWAEHVLSGIRLYSDNLATVGTPNWSQNVGDVINNQITSNVGRGILYNIHFYAATHGQWLRDAGNSARLNSVPLIISEFGTVDASGNGILDLYQSSLWLDWAQKHNYSWFNWSLSIRDETSAALINNDLAGPWVPSDFSTSGRWVLSRLGQTFVDHSNIAYGKTAYMSSTYSDYYASKAVDGVVTGYNPQLAHSAGGPAEWLMIDLGAVYDITETEWFNRLDCCSDRMDSYTIQYSLDASQWVTASVQTDEMAFPTRINLNAAARYVRIVLNKQTALNLSEVQIFGTLAPVDTDDDGVEDHADQCPGTPLGEDVNGVGCAQSQIDDDTDGIMNTDDQCPTTQSGVVVDASGCGIDSDTDGVFDGLDQCPDSPTGFPIDGNGCVIGVTNVSYGKQATQSSTHPSYLNLNASVAVDGNTIGTYPDMAHNYYGNAGEWWQVDLGAVYFITSSDWWNRSDCCSDRMSNYSIQISLDGSTWTTVSDQNTIMARPTSITINEEARYVRMIMNINSHFNFSEAQIFGILSPQDHDDDGVLDSDDLCANTPEGDVVDENGCADSERDSDSDGVIDVVDVCPATVSDVVVDAMGCGIDSDSDGVFDGIDQCSNTPALIAVDTQGCVMGVTNISQGKYATQTSTYASLTASRAVDGDLSAYHNGANLAHTNEYNVGHWWQVDLGDLYYVTNSVWYNRLDCCSDRMNNYSVQGSLDGIVWFTISHQTTQMGYGTDIPIESQTRYIRLVQNKADAINFAEVQIFGVLVPQDADLDGVMGSQDHCPNTPIGEVVDVHGCTDDERDSDFDGVYDTEDQCPSTVIGAIVATDGCPLDSDEDGVYDGLDQCVSTPLNVPVDGTGCIAGITLVSRGKSATQTSTYQSLTASRAVDGDYNGWHNGYNLAHTNGAGIGAWWQVDLGSLYYITDTYWWNRTDCCGDRMNNFVIQRSADGATWIDVSHQTSQMGSGTQISIDGEARYIRLKMNKNADINFAEMEAWGVEQH